MENESKHDATMNPGGIPNDPARRKPPDVEVSLSSVEAMVDAGTKKESLVSSPAMNTSSSAMNAPIADLDAQLHTLSEQENSDDDATIHAMGHC